MILITFLFLSFIYSIDGFTFQNRRIHPIGFMKHMIHVKHSGFHNFIRKDWNGGSDRQPPRDHNFILYESSGTSGSGSENNTTDSFGSMEKLEETSSNNPMMRKWLNFPKETREDIKTTVISLVFALLLRLFIIEPRYIPSLSMFPTFDIGDQLIVDKISKVTRDYKRRDVIVFNPPETYTEMTGNSEALIKRIVAVGGDTIEVKDRKVYVNGVVQKEDYINEDPDYSLAPTIIPAGYCLVFGDNRNHSFDSHVWGLLPEKNIIGRAVLKYWPPWRVGFVEGSS